MFYKIRNLVFEQTSEDWLWFMITGIRSGMKISGLEIVKQEYTAYLQEVLDNY